MRQVTRKGLITMAAAGGAIALGGGYAQADAGAFGGASHSPGVGSGNSVQVPVDVPVNACGNSVNVVGALNPAFGNECANTSAPARPAKPAKPGKGGGSHPGAGSATGGGSQANGGTSHSPGVASGNNVQAPVDVPVNACGNTANVVSALNPAFGNNCGNHTSANPPGKPVQPPNPGNPGPGEPANPGPGDPGTPGNPGTPGTPGPVDPRNGSEVPGGPQSPGSPGGPGTPETPRAPHESNRHTAQTTDDEPTGVAELARTGADSLGLTVPVGAGMLLAGAVLYRRARAAA
ncbi:chaplin [Streptomyces sp. NPDC055078]